MFALPTSENLQRAPQLLDAGTLPVHLHGTYTLDRVGKALQALAACLIHGKLALRVA